MARSARMARVEAVLLLAREPLNSRRLSQLANLADGTEARTLTRKLNRIYDNSSRAFRIEEIAGGFQILTRGKFAPWLRRLHRGRDDVRLSAPAMETLSVVAYRQPVMRAEVESIRGVQCGEILRQLMDRGLVRIVGRADDLGRPFLYGTSKRFLQVFGLRHLDELPRADILRKADEVVIVQAESESAEETADEKADQEQESSEMLIVQPRRTSDFSTPDEDADKLSPSPSAGPRRSPQGVFEEEPVEEEGDEFEFEDDDDEDDLEDDEEEFEDDDLEEDEWEEVEDDDEEDEDDFDDDDDEEWDDEDEEEWADDDWDDEDDDDEEDDDEEDDDTETI